MPPRFEPPPHEPITMSGSRSPGESQLLFGLEPDDGLVQQDVVEHRAERVVGVLARDRIADRVGDGRAERPGAVRVVDGGGDDRCSPGLHHDAPVGLLVVRGPHHVHLALEAEQGAGEGEGASPLAGPGLGGEAVDPGLLVVEGLWHRRVRLVGTGRRDRLVLVVDPGRRAEGLFEAFGTHERRRAPQAEHVDDLSGDVHPGLGRHLLADERHREERGEVVRPDRLAGARVQVGLEGLGQVGNDVEPGLGHLSGWKVPAH